MLGVAVGGDDDVGVAVCVGPGVAVGRASDWVGAGLWLPPGAKQALTMSSIIAMLDAVRVDMSIPREIDSSIARRGDLSHVPKVTKSSDCRSSEDAIEGLLDIGATPRSSVANVASTPETGYLVLADLTGYTAYLAGSELEHAPTIAGDLLETIVGRLEPPYRLAKFEGDAAFLFVEDGRAEPSLLLDAIEASYVAFRRRLRSIDQATTCECNSCRLAPRLDLKLFIHHGEYVRGRIAGRDELAGRDVILAHRLLKVRTGSSTGDAMGEPTGDAGATRGFALFTSSAIEALGLAPGDLGLSTADVEIEQLGRVTTHTLDLEARWQTESGRRRLDGAGGADGVVILDTERAIDAEPSVVWAHLTSPALRARWEGPIRFEETSPGGRRGVGTTTQCVTGRLATLEEIVDWQPYDHVGWRLAVPGLGPVAATADLTVTDRGTNLRVRWVATGDPAGGPVAIDRLRLERRTALDRLASVAGGQLPVLESREVMT